METFTTRDIVYRRVGKHALEATLYLPCGPGPFPAMVDIHGGAWVEGDRSKNAALCRCLAALGVIVMSADMRKEGAPYPASAEDVNAAIRWLKDQAASLGGRPDWVGAIGGSSGGHLVLLNALMGERYAGEAASGTPDARLRLVVALWPIVDPQARYKMAKERGLEKLVAAHQAHWVPLENMREGNPQRILAERRFTDLPPVLLIQGTNDSNMTQDMIDRFVASYREAGGHLDLKRYEGEPHNFIFRDPEAGISQAAMEVVRARIASFDWDQKAR